LIVVEEHLITVERVPSSCGTPGHTDLQITCSCGFERGISHGTRKGAADTILAHRLMAIEKLIGIKLSVDYKSGV
jgi:hypothetical protein